MYLHVSLSLCQMEGSGSPRSRKLHFPVGLWINSPRKHFVKLGGRWPSAISVKSVAKQTFFLLLSGQILCHLHLF